MIMRKNICTAAVAISCAAFAVFAISATPAKKGIKKTGNTTIVSTRGVVKGVKGFANDTPVKIYIEKDKITKIVAQPNQETPSVFARAEELLKKFVGKSVGEAQSMNVDAVSGATYSSKALIKTVKGGLKYYEANK